MTEHTAVTYYQISDESFKKAVYESLFTTSFILLCGVSNPLFDETKHTMQVEVELSDGQEFTIYMDYGDLIGSAHMQEGFTGRLIQSIETAARRA